jgi:hypothetical protein
VTADLRALLDDLDKLYAADSGPPLSVDPEYPTEVVAQHPDGGATHIADCYGVERAALFVGAVNALPVLTAKLRAAADLADSLAYLSASTSRGLPAGHTRALKAAEIRLRQVLEAT